VPAGWRANSAQGGRTDRLNTMPIRRKLGFRRGLVVKFLARPAGPLPIYSGPIDRRYRIGNVVRLSIIFHSLDASFQAHVIHNDKTALRQFLIQVSGHHRGLIQVAIQPWKSQRSSRSRQAIQTSLRQNDLPSRGASGQFSRHAQESCLSISPAYPSFRPDQRDICLG
jgi:hypothetical protein